MKADDKKIKIIISLDTNLDISVSASWLNFFCNWFHYFSDYYSISLDVKALTQIFIFRVSYSYLQNFNSFKASKFGNTQVQESEALAGTDSNHLLEQWFPGEFFISKFLICSWPRPRVIGRTAENKTLHYFDPRRRHKFGLKSSNLLEELKPLIRA